MGDVASGDPARLLLVEALRELDPLARIRADRVQRAHRARELADLKEELHREGAKRRAREPSLGDAQPQRVAAEGPFGVDQLPQLVDECRVAGYATASRPTRRCSSATWFR